MTFVEVKPGNCQDSDKILTKYWLLREASLFMAQGGAASGGVGEIFWTRNS